MTPPNIQVLFNSTILRMKKNVDNFFVGSLAALRCSRFAQ